MALMFPVVMLVLNVSSVAVLWFGGQRVDAGQMQIGALTAFLTYLMQILMSVMMATFMADDDPARRGLRRSHRRGAATPSPRSSPPAEPGRPRAAGAGSWSCDASASATRAPTRRCCTTSRFAAAPGQTTAIDRLHRRRARPPCVSLIPRLFDATAGSVLVDGVDVRELDPRRLWRRIGLVPAAALPVLRHGRVATCGTASPTPPTTSCGRRWRSRRPRDFVRAMPGGPGRADRAGRHQRLRRPAPAAGDRAGAGAPARDLPVRRLVLRAGPGHRRPAAGRARARHRATRRW